MDYRKVFKSGGKGFEGGKFIRGGGGISKKYTNVTNSIPKWIYVASLIQIGRWENVKNQGEMFRGKGGREFRGETFEEKNANVTQVLSEK